MVGVRSVVASILCGYSKSRVLRECPCQANQNLIDCSRAYTAWRVLFIFYSMLFRRSSSVRRFSTQRGMLVGPTCHRFLRPAGSPLSVWSREEQFLVVCPH